MKKIKNYTSSVPAERSVMLIEGVLIDIGATNIMKEYDNKTLEAISFSILQANGVRIPFRLPAKVESVKRLLRCSSEQATRTAWKNVYEWVQLQAVMIKLEQVETVEVFMPYIYSMKHGKTLYELSKDTGFQKLLT